MLYLSLSFLSLEKEHASSPAASHSFHLTAPLKDWLYLVSTGEGTFCCSWCHKFHRSLVTNNTIGYLLYPWNLLSTEKSLKDTKKLVFSKLMTTLIKNQSLITRSVKYSRHTIFGFYLALPQPLLLSRLLICGMTSQAQYWWLRLHSCKDF